MEQRCLLGLLCFNFLFSALAYSFENTMIQILEPIPQFILKSLW